jgi:hypothetical protein
VVARDLSEFKLLVNSSLKIIEDVSNVVSADDITAESRAAIKSPYAHPGSKLDAKETIPALLVCCEYIPRNVNPNETGISINATIKMLLEATFSFLAQNKRE